MEKDLYISDELKVISPVVAGIERRLPYGAPEGYFDTLPDLLLARIGLNSPATAIDMSMPLTNPFKTPDGYFDGLAGNIMDRIRAAEGRNGRAKESDARQELEQLSPLLAGLSRQHPYQVPANFFSGLTDDILSGVQVDILLNEQPEPVPALLAGLRDKPLYMVPTGYFETLSEGIMARIARLSPVAVTRSSAIHLAESPVASSQTASQSGARIVPFFRKKVFRYAAAAVLTGLLVTAGLRIYNKPGAGSPDALGNLSRVSDQEIENYLDNHNVPLSEAVTNSTANLDINDSDIKGMLGDVSDDELKEYMDDHGAAKDLATN